MDETNIVEKGDFNNILIPERGLVVGHWKFRMVKAVYEILEILNFWEGPSPPGFGQ
jgi:hypothetical protein